MGHGFYGANCKRLPGRVPNQPARRKLKRVTPSITIPYHPVPYHPNMIGFERRNVRLFGKMGNYPISWWNPNEYKHVSPQTFLISLES